MKKRSELLFRLILIPLDYLMLVLSFGLAYYLRHEQSKPLAYNTTGRAFLYVILPVLIIWLVIYAFAGLYDLKATRSRATELSRVIMASALGVMSLIIIDFFVQNPIFPSKAIPIYGFVFAIILVSVERFIVYGIQRYLYKFGVGTHNTLIIGNGARRIQFQKNLEEDSRIYNIVKNTTNNSDLSIETLQKIHDNYRLDDVFLLESNDQKINITKLINFCRQHQLQLHIVATVSELYDAPMQMSRIRNIPVIEVMATPLEGWGRIIKRLFDIVLVALSFVIALPLMFVIALLIKLTDPGRVFYRHERLTRSGKKIKVIKFRTMKQKYCTGGEFGGKSDLEVLESFNDPKLIEEFKSIQKVKDDPRVSKIGKFLRQSSLDELPQLFNILKGDLSFVGPRPIVESELERYGDESGLFLHIRPGLTGLWQVSGRNDVDYSQRVKLDIYYIENWRLSFDIAILIKTVGVVLFKKNGY